MYDSDTARPDSTGALATLITDVMIRRCHAIENWPRRQGNCAGRIRSAVPVIPERAPGQEQGEHDRQDQADKPDRDDDPIKAGHGIGRDER